MSGCCERRPEDGVVDRVTIERAVSGRSAQLSPTEIQIVIHRLMSKGLGLNEISHHLSYSRSQVADIQQRLRNRMGR